MHEYLKTVHDAYQADNERFWKLFSYMTVINGGLLYVLKDSNNKWFQVLLALAGIAQSLIWAGLQRRYGCWCSWYSS